MTLLPIIYTSLIFFFSLMLLVLLVSYITFKLRKQENPAIVEERDRLIQKQYNFQNPSIEKPYYQQYYERPRTAVRLDEIKKPEKKRSTFPPRPRATSTKKRIEIINEKFIDKSASYNNVFFNNYAD
ncbi:hypothetical protein [Melioribacter sp. OK-6-Me]|uniref:hypothetical protein n=1 Tax=unclassified Melioribacter TaxID=2627329 RepID=UPI003EDB5EA9